jgi:hypothetical protein
MKPISLPADRRASMRPLRILLAAFAVTILVGPLAAAPARAAAPPGWSSEMPVEGSLNTRPAVAKDADGHLGVAWQEMGSSPGIMFATDASGAWVTARVSTGDDWTPDLAFDTGGAAHVVFTRFGTGAGLYHATNATGTWVTTLVRADIIPWSPSLAIDGAGALRVAYASEGFTPGIWYLTNATGPWAATRVTTGTWDSEPSLALDASGKAHIAFARYDRPSPGLFIATNATGAWTSTRLTTNAALDDYPALLFDAAGHRHVAAWRSLGEDGDALLYATDTSGAWQAMTVGMPMMGIGIGIPAIGLDGNGAPEVVARLAGMGDDDDTLWRFSDLPWGAAARLMLGDERNEEFPDILRDASGRLVVAYRGAWNAPGIVVHREDPDEDTTIAPSVLVGFASLRSDGTGAKHLAFERYATDAADGISYATDASGAWVDETLGASHGPPDLALSGPAPYVAAPDRLYWNSGAGWQQHTYQESNGTRAAIALGMNSIIAHATDGGLRLIDLGSLDPWADAVVTYDGRDTTPDAALGTAGAEPVIVFVRDGDLYAVTRTSSGWTEPQLVDSTTVWDPSVVAEQILGTTFIAYDRGTSTAGIYVATGGQGGTGSWGLTRLSRAYADIEPMLSGGSQALYLTWARACGGPSPGIYVATNRTGTWVTRQIVASCDAGQPSITVLPDGRMSVAYLQDPGGIVVLTETSLTGASAANVTTAARSWRALELAPEASLASGGVALEPAAAGSALRRGLPTVSRSQLDERFSSTDR